MMQDGRLIRWPSLPLLNVMTQAALKAAKGLIRDLGELEQLQVSKKGPADYVSRADRRAESILRGELAKARPNYGLLMEESGAVAGSDTSNRWIVDPLDGTTNFLHGIPHFAISIALEQDGEPYRGDLQPRPRRDVRRRARLGAFLNGRRLRVSGRRDVEQGAVRHRHPVQGPADHPLFLRQLAAVMAVSSGVRRFGAAASISPTSPPAATTASGRTAWQSLGHRRRHRPRPRSGRLRHRSRRRQDDVLGRRYLCPPAAACMRSCCGCWPRRRRHIRTPSLRHRQSLATASA